MNILYDDKVACINTNIAIQFCNSMYLLVW